VIAAVRDAIDTPGLNLTAYSFWAFTDIFTEGGFPSHGLPFHGGFGLMNVYGGGRAFPDTLPVMIAYTAVYDIYLTGRGPWKLPDTLPVLHPLPYILELNMIIGISILQGEGSVETTTTVRKPAFRAPPL
jgi:hypothetical protein